MRFNHFLKPISRPPCHHAQSAVGHAHYQLGYLEMSPSKTRSDNKTPLFTEPISYFSQTANSAPDDAIPSQQFANLFVNSIRLNFFHLRQLPSQLFTFELLSMSYTAEKHVWIVQKFGGTSIGKFMSKITGNIIPFYTCRSRVAVVCSVISGQDKETGTTSLLCKAVELADNGKQEGIDDVFSLIKKEHMRMLDIFGSQVPSAIAEAKQAYTIVSLLTHR